MFITSVSALEFRTIMNPFTGKLDFYTTGNFSGDNVTALYLIGNLSCSDVYQDGSGTDTNFCNDAIGGAGSGQSPFTNNTILIFPDVANSYPSSLVLNQTQEGNLTASWIIGNLSAAFGYLWDNIIGSPSFIETSFSFLGAITGTANNTQINSSAFQDYNQTSGINLLNSTKALAGDCGAGYTVQNTSTTLPPDCVPLPVDTDTTCGGNNSCSNVSYKGGNISDFENNKNYSIAGDCGVGFIVQNTSKNESPECVPLPVDTDTDTTCGGNNSCSNITYKGNNIDVLVNNVGFITSSEDVNITPHDLNGSNHTGSLDTVRVTQYGGTYFSGNNQQTINDLLFGYISSLAYIPSHFGSNDGATDATVDYQSTSSVRIADCTNSGVNDNGWDDGSNHPSTTDNTWDADVNNDFYELSANTNLSLFINNVFVDAALFDGTTSPTDGTYITIDNEDTNELGIIYGQMAATTPFSVPTTKGYMKVNYTHLGLGSVYEDTTEVFYDNGTTPSVGAVEVGEHTYSSNKAVSGIYYYSDGDTFNITITSSSNAFMYSFPANIFFCDLNYNGFGATDKYYAYTDSEVSGESNPPAWDDIITLDDRPGFTVAGNAHNNAATIRCRVEGNPRSDSSYDVSTNNNYLVNSYGTTSTVLAEYFDDENRRMPEGDYDTVPGSITGQWTSTSCLTDGQALLQLGRLDYPHTDWSTGYNPDENSCDYSSFTADSNYTRAMYDSGDPHTSATIYLPPLTNTDIAPAGTVQVLVKLPTQTGWLDLGVAYDSGTFTGADGDGCQTSYSSNSFGCTFGGFSTANSGYLIMVKIVMEGGTSEYVSTLQVTDW